MKTFLEGESELICERKIMFQFVRSKASMDFAVLTALWLKSQKWSVIIALKHEPFNFWQHLPWIRLYRKATALTLSIRGKSKHYNLRLASSEVMGISTHRVELLDSPDITFSLSLRREKYFMLMPAWSLLIHIPGCLPRYIKLLLFLRMEPADPFSMFLAWSPTNINVSLHFSPL